MIEPRSKQSETPLSFNQDVQLLTDWRAGLRAGRIISLHPMIAHHLSGDPDETAIENALNQIVNRHEVLRSAFQNISSLSPADAQAIYERISRKDMIRSSLFKQRVDDTARLDLALKSAVVDNIDDPAVAMLLQEEARKPFNYDRPPLIRATLFKVGRQDYILQIVFHHLVCDGWSMGIVQREFSSLYRRFSKRESSALPELPVQYGDFAAWQRQQVESGKFNKMISYWTEQWEQYMPEQLRACDLPFARPAPAKPTFASQTEAILLDVGMASELIKFARSKRITLFMFWLSAIALVFHMYSRKTRIALFTDLANRTQPEVEHLIGWFANSVLLGISILPDRPVLTLLEHVRDVVLTAQSCQAVPLGALLGFVEKERLEHLDTFDWISFDFFSAGETKDRAFIEGLDSRPAAVPNTRSRTTLCLTVRTRADSATASCIYSTDRFEGPDIRKLLETLRRVVTTMVTFPAGPVADLYALIQ